MIEPDAGCVRSLLWRLDLPPTTDWSALTSKLVARGLRVGGVPQVRTFEREGAFVLVVVPRTGRVQIRIDYLVPQTSRQALAETAAQLIFRLTDAPG